MQQTSKAPIIGVVSCQKQLDGYPIQSVNQFYLNAIQAFGAIAVPFTAGHGEADLARLLNLVDGILLPGSHSNVAPHHYGASHHEPKTDPGRDATSLPLIRLCAKQGKPILGICRGFQEMNVALGGSLHPQVHELAGYLDHREAATDDFAIKYQPVHSLRVVEGGLFSQWLGEEAHFQVNSLHGQGVNQLAAPLRAEGRAPDSLVEAFSLPGHPFFVAVQWHPEWQATENPFSRLLFEKFITSTIAQRDQARLTEAEIQ